MKFKVTFLFYLLFSILYHPVMAQLQSGKSNIVEKLIYSTTFGDWSDQAASVDPGIITQHTNFSAEQLDFSLTGIFVDPDGTDAKFTSAGVTPGFLRMEKQTGNFADSEMAIELTALKSITKVDFMVAATGSNRGMKLWKKVGNAEWEIAFNNAANPAGGMKVEVPIEAENVALKFTNFNPSQYAFLLNLDIYGKVEVNNEQVKLTTEVVPTSAGTIVVKPNSSEYDKGMEVTLSAIRKFGYRFRNWTTESGEVVSESESFSYRLNDHTTLKAVFETIPVHQLSIDRTNGAKSYMINLIPAPTFIDGKGYYESGTEVSLQPASNMILTFNHWENGSTDPKRVILMESDMKLTAHYSAASYIAGWDFAISDPKQDRSADFIAETTNAGMFQALSADGTTKSWLAKGEDLYQEGRHAVINWHGANDNVYFQARFSTKNYRNIRIYSKMLSCYFSYKTQKIEWSVDGKNFEALNMLTFDAQKTWYDFNTSLPETANGQDMIFIRWIPDYNAGTLGNTADKDGTSITDIFILADKDLINDEEAPLLISSLPENMATNISANGSIILNFNEQVQPGSANCTLNGESMTGVFNNSTVIFRYNGLEYDSDYTFDIPAGSLKDMSGNLFAGGEIKFRTMVKVQPEPRLFDLVVAADGSGDVKTVKEAIMLAPENSIKPYLIFIKEGIYKEHIEIPLNKPYIHLIGQDPEKVIITDDQLCGGEESVTGKPALHVSQGATVVVNAENFFAENISFENSWGIDKNSGPQALALFTNNDRIILNNCRLRSYQDTYLTSTRKTTDRHYLHNCFIEGAVDFIYGGGDVYFDACTLYIVRKSGGYIVAPSHKTDTKWGYVFMNNTITAPATPSETNIWLGRPWKDAPKTVFLHTKAEVTIPAAGWFDNMGAIPAIFADYNTVDGQGNKVDLSHRIEDYWYWADDSKTQKITGKAKKSLTDNEAASYTIKNVLSGDDQWQPNALIEQTGAPVVRNESGSLTWDAIPFAISYVIFKDDQVVAFSEKNTYKPADQTTATYKVRAVNEAGSLGEESAPIVYIPMGLGETETTEVGITGHNQELIFTKIVRPTTISVYQTNGIIVNRREVTGNTIIPVQKGIYIVRIQSDQHSTSRIVSVF